MIDLQIKCAKLKEEGQSLRLSTKKRIDPIESLVHSCMWCNSIDHLKRECEDFTKALHKYIFFQR